MNRNYSGAVKLKKDADPVPLSEESFTVHGLVLTASGDCWVGGRDNQEFPLALDWPLQLPDVYDPATVFLRGSGTVYWFASQPR